MTCLCQVEFGKKKNVVGGVQLFSYRTVALPSDLVCHTATEHVFIESQLVACGLQPVAYNLHSFEACSQQPVACQLVVSALAISSQAN